MLEALQTKYYNFELVEYLKSCSLDELKKIVKTLKSCELNKTGIKILGSVLFALDNYDKISTFKSVQKIA